tara:strand:+ start:1927 stop:3177 length:1251 start_codon:yes stop_codon:yes gene_type:complete
MALVDLKSKLNQFRGKFTPNSPYAKNDSEIETKLESTVSVEGKTSLLQKNNVNTTASTFLKGLKQFGIGSLPLENTYEDSIKQNQIFYGNESINNIVETANIFENIRKGVKDIIKDPLNIGAVSKILNVSEEIKLKKYQAKAYKKVKGLGEQGSKVLNVNQKISRTFEGPIKGGKSTKNVDTVNIAPYGEDASDKDIIPFKFYDVYNDKHITFRAILTGITDNVSTEYNPERYVGRSENVYTYQGTNRQVSFTFDVYPKSRQEMPVLWEKINYLYGMCYPNYTEAYGGQTMVSPITTLTIGNLYTDTPGYIASLNLSVPDNSTWEIEDNLQLPHYCQIAVEYVYIGKYLPNAKGKHFELNWITDKNNTQGTYTNNNDVDRTDEYSWVDKKTFRQELKASLRDAWKNSVSFGDSGAQ